MASISPESSAVSAPKSALPMTFDIALRIAGSFLFVAVHVIGVAFAFIYASAGLMHLGKTGLIVESVIVGVPVLITCAYVFMLAYRAESDPDNN